MKNNPLLRLTAFILVIPIFIGCSKQSPVSNKDESAVGKPGNVSIISTMKTVPQNNGSITGTLIPAPLKSGIVAFNENYSSPEINADVNGSFTINDLPPGYYTILIVYLSFGATEYLKTSVGKVQVQSQLTTNMGNISLD